MDHEVVARAVSERGEVVVRRRDDGALELRVNGVFVMDTAGTVAERALAHEALNALSLRPNPHAAHLLVGGLGTGSTLREVLADPGVRNVTVVEIEPSVVAWMRDGTLPGADLLADPRVTVVVDDVRRVVAASRPAAFDAILLDVDNGPDYLVLDTNAAVYEQESLARCRDALTIGGVLVVWSSTPSPRLQLALAAVFGDVRVRPVPVDLQGRNEEYWLLRATRPR